MNNKITCVIPSYNQGRFLGEAIASIVEQKKFPQVELILMDGGSKDNSLEIINKHKKYFHYYSSEKDGGQAAAINEGVRKGRGEYVCWLNSDDRLEQDAFLRQIDFIQNNPGTVAVHGLGQNIDENGDIISMYPSLEVNYENMLKSCPVCQPTVMVTRKAWEAVGGLNESFNICLDYDLWWRLEKLGEFGFIKEILASTRIHGETKTARLRQQHYHEVYRILKREHGSVPIKWWVTGFFEEKYGCFPKDSNLLQRVRAFFCLPKYYRDNCIKG